MTSGRGRRADAERNAQRLLAAARELFDEQGPDVALDEIARRAGVGNATLYRHFPTRGDLLIAVYADEVASLCEQAEELGRAAEPGDAFFTWLEALAVHVATRRTLAFAGTQGSGDRRTALFERWHTALTSAARILLTRAQGSGAVRPDVTVDEVLALVNALAASDTDRVRRLLAIVRDGLSGRGAPPAPS